MQARISLKKQPTQVGFDSFFSPRFFSIFSFYYFLVLFSYCKSQAQPQEHDVSSIAVSLKKKFFGFEGFFLFPYGVQLYVSFYVETFTQMRAKLYVPVKICCIICGQRIYRKAFSIICVNIFFFFRFFDFFLIDFCTLEKCGVTTHCLYRDLLT